MLRQTPAGVEKHQAEPQQHVNRDSLCRAVTVGQWRN